MTSNTDGDPERAEREAVDWFARLRAGNPGDQPLFEDWYASDQAHADAYDRVLRSWAVMGDVARAPSCPIELHLGRHGRSRSMMAVLSAAAAAVLLALLGFGLIGLGPDFLGSSPAIAYRTSKGMILTIHLADGSQMTLDGDSAVITRIGRQRRVQLLRGRVRFDIALKPNKAFTIETGGGTVEANASSIDVSADRNHLTVALWRGAVDVRDASGKPLAAEPHAGEAVRLDGGGAAAARIARAVDPRWTSGMLSFDDAPLIDVIAGADRYTQSQIILTNPALGRLHFTGSFRAGDPQLARTVAAMYGLTRSTTPSGDLLLGLPADKAAAEPQ